jgi:hypothetical protein
VVTTFATRREGRGFRAEGRARSRPFRDDHVLSTEHLVLLNFDRDKSDQQCEAGDDPNEQPAPGPLEG